MKTPEEKLLELQDVSLKLNAELPTDIMLKGDGTFWVQLHGNDGIRPRKATQEEILKIVYKAMKTSERMISI
ncbi:hypothetical protein KAR91_29850 [Candidatus Pacearchaeota archaeon]|nr:hypothetical protein [Candidatus Pacearchaeota archaeon]